MSGVVPLWNLKKPNPHDVSQASAVARAEVKHRTQDWAEHCAKSCGWDYGWQGTGEESARTLRAEQVLHLDRNPPAGALVHFAIGKFDHVAYSMGAGVIASNDILIVGYISFVTIEKIEQGWGAKYLGWSLPYFPKAWGPVSPPVTIKKPAVVVPQHAANTVSLKSLNRAILDKKSDPQILLVAKRMRQLGFLGFNLNDTWGAGKEAAVKKLQKKYGYKNVTGNIGIDFLNNLFKGSAVQVTS